MPVLETLTVPARSNNIRESRQLSAINIEVLGSYLIALLTQDIVLSILNVTTEGKLAIGNENAAPCCLRSSDSRYMPLLSRSSVREK